MCGLLRVCVCVVVISCVWVVCCVPVCVCVVVLCLCWCVVCRLFRCCVVGDVICFVVVGFSVFVLRFVVCCGVLDVLRRLCVCRVVLRLVL